MTDAGASSTEEAETPSATIVRCKDCEFWYGAEDDGYGPCEIKNARGDARFVTFGTHGCDEIYKHGRPAPTEP